MSKLSKEQFDAYLEQIKELAEGPFEEMQPEIEVRTSSPRSSTSWPRKTTCIVSLSPLSTVDGIFRSSTSCAFRSSSPVVLAACVCTCTMLLT